MASLLYHICGVCMLILHSLGSSTEVQKLFVLTSSKHLMLASPVFRAMLRPRSHRLSEADALMRVGNVSIPLPEDNLPAMSLILKILHHRYSDVPRKIPLSLLAQVAVLVDKYDLKK